MKTQHAKPLAIFLSVLCWAAILSGCSYTERPVSSAQSTPAQSVNSTSSTSSTSTFSSTSTQSSSTSSTSSAVSTSIAQSGPHFSFSLDPALEQPESANISICSLSQALDNFSEISAKPAEGTPEDIVKTLLERNILCFAAMQGKCWVYAENTAEDYVPISSGYITSVEQVQQLFDSTYTADQSWRLMHPQEAGGYGDVFQVIDDKLCFQSQHLRKNNGDSFSVPTYAAIIEANDSEITFGRYYTSKPDGGTQPNNMLFKAINENGAWRLDTYITDAPAFVQQYSSLITTGRTGAPELMELAKEQVGNIGGRKYWEWYGFDTHIEWCAAFVSWIYNEGGKDEPFFTGCYTGAEWFKERGQWGDINYPDIAPADCIFFDWNLDGDADHVGLVLGTDGDNVYTIEGNRDDICITRTYPCTYQWIAGYGLMNW